MRNGWPAEVVTLCILAIAGLCCTARVRLKGDGQGWPRTGAPHLDLRADHENLMRPGRVLFTALLHGMPIAVEWNCSQESWVFGDGQSALRAEDNSTTPCAGLEREFEHPHYYETGTYEVILTLLSKRGHRMPSNVITIHVGGTTE